MDGYSRTLTKQSTLTHEMLVTHCHQTHGWLIKHCHQTVNTWHRNGYSHIVTSCVHTDTWMVSHIVSLGELTLTHGWLLTHCHQMSTLTYKCLLNNCHQVCHPWHMNSYLHTVTRLSTHTQIVIHTLPTGCPHWTMDGYSHNVTQYLSTDKLSPGCQPLHIDG